MLKLFTRITLLITLWAASPASFAQAQRARVVVPPVAGAPAPTELNADLKRCYGAAQRSLRKHHLFAEFRLGDDLEGRTETARRKFSPRTPIDVDRVVKLPAELLEKKTNEWVAAELWCGFQNGQYAAADVVSLKRR
ncbi:MAG: hypothetical protein ABIU95_10080 [Burkholderiales bacterium]